MYLTQISVCWPFAHCLLVPGDDGAGIWASLLDALQVLYCSLCSRFSGHARIKYPPPLCYPHLSHSSVRAALRLPCPRQTYPVHVAPRLSRLMSPPLLDLTILSAPHYSMGLDYSHGCTLILWSAPRLDSNQPGQNTDGTARLGSIVAATRCHGLLRHCTALTTSY
jgi:hypothetical protein